MAERCQIEYLMLSNLTYELRTQNLGVHADQKSTVFADLMEENDDGSRHSMWRRGDYMREAPVYPSIPTRILLPIDFSPSSQAALEMASDLAQHFHAELYLVNVIPEFPTTTIPDLIPEAVFLEKAREYAELHLAKCKAALATRGVKSSFSVEVGNDVVGNIMEVVDREHIDMIVVSTHGISGWHPLVFGSIAEKVVKLAQCPLLLLRSAKPESGVKMPSGRSMEWW
jgi:nucleotide-binding universal stress UspA family protein